MPPILLVRILPKRPCQMNSIASSNFLLWVTERTRSRESLLLPRLCPGAKRGNHSRLNH